jgi:hypothetical protein
MKFHPRHFILLAVILGLFAWNIVRYRHARAALLSRNEAIARTVPTPRADTPTWRAFDHAASLRDASNADFNPVAQDLRQQILTLNSDPTADAIKGCLTWLEFYRQSVSHPAPNDPWKTRSQNHLDGCVEYHLDTTL